MYKSYGLICKFMSYYSIYVAPFKKKIIVSVQIRPNWANCKSVSPKEMAFAPLFSFMVTKQRKDYLYSHFSSLPFSYNVSKHTIRVHLSLVVFC